MVKLVSLHVILLNVAEPIDDIKWGLNVHNITYEGDYIFKKYTYTHESDLACRSQELKGMEEHIQ